MSAVAIAVDAATDAAHGAMTDESLARDAKFDRIAAEARERLARASGAALALMLVEELSAAEYQRHLDVLLERVRTLSHAQIREQLHLAGRVAAAWDVIEDTVVGRIVDREMRK